MLFFSACLCIAGLTSSMHFQEGWWCVSEENDVVALHIWGKGQRWKQQEETDRTPPGSVCFVVVAEDIEPTCRGALVDQPRMLFRGCACSKDLLAPF
mgnify:CR=1 FL=1